MKLEEIQELWDVDCKIDRSSLDTESLNSPLLHNKYLKIYNQEKLRYFILESQYKKLTRVKQDYFKGVLSEEELKERGWEPFRLRLTNTEIEKYCEADEDIANLQYKLLYQKEKISTLLEIIKSINNRGYNIKNAIDFMRFTQGQ